MNSMYLDALPMYKFQLKYLPEHIAVHEGGCAGSVLVAIREAEQVPHQHHATTTTSTMAPPPPACSYSSLQSATLPLVHVYYLVASPRTVCTALHLPLVLPRARTAS